MGLSSSWRVSSSRFRVPILDKLANNLIYWGYFSSLACEPGQFIEVGEILTGVRKPNCLSNITQCLWSMSIMIAPSGQSLVTFSLSLMCQFIPDRQNREWRRGQLATDERGTGSNSQPRLLINAMDLHSDWAPRAAWWGTGQLRSWVAAAVAVLSCENGTLAQKIWKLLALSQVSHKPVCKSSSWGWQMLKQW